MVVMVEGGVSGGATSAPVVGQIFNQIFQLPEIPPGQEAQPLTPEFFAQFAQVDAQLAAEEPVNTGAPSEGAGIPVETAPEEILPQQQRREERRGDPAGGRIRGARGLRL
ncbi:hypothetical protein QPK87_04145 [Kamptonema cortianum]|nr:hypothetical protein [Kamptonema cortianum]